MAIKRRPSGASLAARHTKELRAAADEIRDIMNWVAVFKTEYDLPAEVVQTLRKKLSKVAMRLV